MADLELYMILGIVAIFVVVIGAILWSQIRQAKKKSSLEEEAHVSPSSFEAEAKTKMMSSLDKRESQLRRERILEGGSLPELTELAIYSPIKNEKIDSPEVDVRGKTAVRSIVWINNQAAFVDVDGSFIGSVPLYRGKNSIDVCVVGPYGRNMRTKVTVNCTSKDTPTISSTDTTFLLPHTGLDIRIEEEQAIEKTTGISRESIEVGTPSGKIGEFDAMIASESDIDPSVLAALKGDPLDEIAIETPEPVDLETIEPEFAEPDIPDIPDIAALEEPEIPDIPDVIQEEVEESETAVVDEESIEEAVKVIEEVVKTDDDEFQPDKMIPKQPGEKITADSLEEFQPLKQEIIEGSKELKVETKRQKLDDDRQTEILQHTGYLTLEDGELEKIVKLEKRVEKIGKKWYSTIGLVNISSEEINKLEIIENIGGILELKEALPANIEEPIIDSLPEGNIVTWNINKIKPEQKLFITYNEDVNTLEIIQKEQISPKIIIRR